MPNYVAKSYFANTKKFHRPGDPVDGPTVALLGDRASDLVEVVKDKPPEPEPDAGEAAVEELSAILGGSIPQIMKAVDGNGAMAEKLLKLERAREDQARGSLIEKLTAVYEG